jgi:hypothetical protein
MEQEREVASSAAGKKAAARGRPKSISIPKRQHLRRNAAPKRAHRGGNEIE